MAEKFCSYKKEHMTQLVFYQRSFVLTFCVFHLLSSFMTTLSNLLVIRALWKASSISVILKTLLLSLAFSDLAVGLIAQLMYGVIIAVTLQTAPNQNYAFLCPNILTTCFFFLFFLACGSFCNVVVIAVDRLVAISLHLRYQELVTPKRIITVLASVWITSAAAALLYVSLPSFNGAVAPIIEFIGVLLSTVAYIYIYRVVKYHQNQIHIQITSSNPQEINLIREKKFAFNSLIFYAVFITCYLPHLCATVLVTIDESRVSFMQASYATFFFVFINSLLNPLVYCWRFREIRQIVKRTLKNIFLCCYKGLL